MAMLLDACPSFEPQWQDFLNEYQADDIYRAPANHIPYYIALADLACHLIGMLERGETACFPTIFAVVERLHLEGDSYVQTAATVGLLEDLQNTYFYSLTRPEQFRPFFGAETAYWWDRLYRFWEHGELLTDQRGGAG